MRAGEAAPSRTALNVALNVVMLGADPGTAALLPEGSADATARLLVAAGVVRDATLRLARSRSMARLVRCFERGMPGQLEGLARRKRSFEREVRRAIDAGARQVLVLGAGYDTLAWRLAPEYTGVRFFEIDLPATGRVKAKGVAELGAHPNLRLLVGALGRERLADVLARAPEWDAAVGSVVVAEGLLMYLPESAVRELFRQVAASTGPASRVAFSHVGERSSGGPDAGPWSWLALWSLRMIGEPWRWGLDPSALDDFLRACGWQTMPADEGVSTRVGIEYFAVAAPLP